MKGSPQKTRTDDYSIYDFVLSPRSSNRLVGENQFVFEEELGRDPSRCCLCFENYYKDCRCRFTCVVCGKIDRATYPSDYHKENRKRYTTCVRCGSTPLCIECHLNKTCSHLFYSGHQV